MKKIVFYKNLDQQRTDSLSYTDHLTYRERLEECRRLTRKAFWRFYQGNNDTTIKKIVAIYKGREDETLEDFYKRIRN